MQTSRGHHFFKSASDYGESLRATQRPQGHRPCSHSTECLVEGHGPKTDKCRTVNDTTCSDREGSGAETGGTRSPELVEGSKELWRQLCSLVVGGLLRWWEGEAVQSEETCKHVA